MGRTTTVNDLNDLFSKNKEIFTEAGFLSFLGFKFWESYQFYLFFTEIIVIFILIIKAHRIELYH